MTTALLVISVFLLSYLSIYASLFLVLSSFAFLSKNKNNIPSKEDINIVYEPISVLIPSHNEGEGLIDAIETVIKQNYSGSIDIHILLNDLKNNPAEIKSQFFPFCRPTTRK